MIYGYCSVHEDENKGKIYFIRDGLGNIKIGIAKDPSRRKKELQTANPNELEIFFIMSVPKMWDAQVIEKELHERFSDCRKIGEWFAEDPVIDWLRNGEIVVGGYKFENIDW